MSNYQIFIDLGTTTLAFLDTQGHTLTIQNHQSSFGADVISRIKASCEGHGPILQQLIQKDLSDGIKKLLELSSLPEDTPLSITIAANTTMVHLLMGYSCEGIASFPFSPVTLDKVETSASLLSLNGTITLLPGSSTFIGGDIISGLLYLEADTWEKPRLLLDLGTNGEMVLGTKDSYLSASAAAGPALEGGGISCGVGGIKGAICKFSMDKTPPFQTIGYGRPVGICGTGVVDIMAQLIIHKKMDENGLLEEPYFTDGFPVTKAFGKQKPITFTQADIRQVQMAKSAICTGVEILLARYGISYEELDTLYLAGTLGTKIDTKSAARMGLFPEALLDKVVAVGNTSLTGAELYASNPKKAEERIQKIRDSITSLSLANLTEFQDLFIKNINFRI